MKILLRISLGLNLFLLGGLIFVLTKPHPEKSVPGAAVAAPQPPVPVAAPPAPPQPFRWSQLESTNDYRVYIGNLRAAGCPEPTIEDIVRGDTGRAFAWERDRLRLDGSGTGPWSRSRERLLAASLLGIQPPAAEITATAGAEPPAPDTGGNPTVAAAASPAAGGTVGTAAYPLFLQNPNWHALGFNPDQQAAIAQVRQQFLSQVNGPASSSGDATGQNAGGQVDANSSGSSALTRWHDAVQLADQQLRDELGAQGYMAYEQQQYLSWFAPQAQANTSGGNLIINPDAFHLQ